MTGRRVHLRGGTKDGQSFRYPHPLPKSLVYQDPTNGIQEEYFRKPESTQYIHPSDWPGNYRPSWWPKEGDNACQTD